MAMLVLAASAASNPAKRHVYCFGDPGLATGGWLGDTTSAGWDRQGEKSTLPERVVYDDSVRVMQSVGCHTVRAEIRPTDLARDGSINTSQKAAIAKGPGWPELGIAEGQTHWYGFAFATNRRYRPHRSNPATGDYSGNFNLTFSFHDYILNGLWGPKANIQLEAKTIAPSDGRTAWRYAPGAMKKMSPVWGLSISGGNKDIADWYAHNRDPKTHNTAMEYAFYNSPIVGGQKVEVQFKVTWGAHLNGAVQLWLNGTKVLDVKGVSNMYYSPAAGGKVDNLIYPVFENYRRYDTTLPTNSIYYGGLIVGVSRRDVGVPNGRTKVH